MAQALRGRGVRGLLVSDRTAGGQRVYGPAEPADPDRVAMLRTLFAAGLTSRAIAEVMPYNDDPTMQNANAAELVMRHERNRLTTALATLESARDCAGRSDRVHLLSPEHARGWLIDDWQPVPRVGTGPMDASMRTALVERERLIAQRAETLAGQVASDTDSWAARLPAISVGATPSDETLRHLIVVAAYRDRVWSVTVVIRDGVISEIGPRLSSSPGAAVISAEGRAVTSLADQTR